MNTSISSFFRTVNGGIVQVLNTIVNCYNLLIQILYKTTYGHVIKKIKLVLISNYHNRNH